MSTAGVVPHLGDAAGYTVGITTQAIPGCTFHRSVVGGRRRAPNPAPAPPPSMSSKH